MPLKPGAKVCIFFICIFTYVMPWLRCPSLRSWLLSWWRHQMETFPRYWPFVNSPHKGQWRGALMFSLFCAWTNGWVNNRDGGDLRRYRTHDDVTVTMLLVAGLRSAIDYSTKTVLSTMTNTSLDPLHGDFRMFSGNVIVRQWYPN